MNRTALAFTAASLILSSAAAASAEEIRLTNGRILTGSIERSDDQSITLRIPEMGTMKLQRSEVVSIGGKPVRRLKAEAVDGAPAETAGAEGAKPFSAAGAGSSDAISWALFKSPDRAVQITYPRGWHVMETADRYPYTVTIEPTPPDKDLATMAPVVIELFKYFHVSTTTQFGRGTPEEVLARYAGQVLPSMGQGSQVLAQRDITVQGVPGKLVELKTTDPRGTVKLQMYVAAAVKGDVLATLFCQAPETEFEARRTMCEHATEEIQPFSKDAKAADNALIDAESGKLVGRALEALQSGDAQKVFERFEQAVRINPGDPITRISYGSLLMQLAKDQSGQERTVLLKRSEEELRLAGSFLQTSAAKEAKPLLAQVYFVLGEIAYYGWEKPDQAKALYEQALSFHEHGGAAEALGRYSGVGKPEKP